MRRLVRRMNNPRAILQNSRRRPRGRASGPPRGGTAMAASATGRLRKPIAHRKAMLQPGAASALAARVIEDAGFEAIDVTAAGVTNTALQSSGSNLEKARENR